MEKWKVASGNKKECEDAFTRPDQLELVDCSEDDIVT